MSQIATQYTSGFLDCRCVLRDFMCGRKFAYHRMTIASVVGYNVDTEFQCAVKRARNTGAGRNFSRLKIPHDLMIDSPSVA